MRLAMTGGDRRSKPSGQAGAIGPPCDAFFDFLTENCSTCFDENNDSSNRSNALFLDAKPCPSCPGTLNARSA